MPDDRFLVVVHYGHAYRTTISMNALYHALSQALTGLGTAMATLAGWQQLCASLYGMGHPAWMAALRGTAERLAIRNVRLEYEQSPNGLWLLGTADFYGTWAASPGVDCAWMRGAAAATLDTTPGLPGFIAPAVDDVEEARLGLRGMVRVGKPLYGQQLLPLATFDSSIALDLERLYYTLVGRCDGEDVMWCDFLDAWERSLRDTVVTTQICTAIYTLTLVPSEMAYEDALRSYAQLLAYRHKPEDCPPTLPPALVSALF
jgi:hypothetical protein